MPHHTCRCNRIGTPMGQAIRGPLCRMLNPAIPPSDPGTSNIGATAPPTIAGAPGSQYQAAPGSGPLVNDPDYERLIEAMEADADDAHEEWKSNLSSRLFSYFAPEVLAQYKAEGID